MKVNLKGDTVKFGDLFSKMEIIPLETLDSCLIMNIEKIELHNNQLFIFDNLRPALYVFDKKGKYIKQIGKKGEGPDEFQVITDVFIDKTRNVILFLSHFGSVLIYDIEGNLLQKEKNIKEQLNSIENKNHTTNFFIVLNKDINKFIITTSLTICDDIPNADRDKLDMFVVTVTFLENEIVDIKDILY